MHDIFEHIYPKHLKHKYSDHAGLKTEQVCLLYYFYTAANFLQTYYGMGMSSSVDSWFPCSNFCSWRPILFIFEHNVTWHKIQVKFDNEGSGPYPFVKKGPKGVFNFFMLISYFWSYFDAVFFNGFLVTRPFCSMSLDLCKSDGFQDIRGQRGQISIFTKYRDFLFFKRFWCSFVSWFWCCNTF